MEKVLNHSAISFSTEECITCVILCPSNGLKKQFGFFPYFISVLSSCINVVLMFPKNTFTSKQLFSFRKGENLSAGRNNKTQCLRNSFCLPPEKYIFVLQR